MNEISLCKNCYCMTKTIRQGHTDIFKCGKCGHSKFPTDNKHIKSGGTKEDESLSDVANVGSVDKYPGIAKSKVQMNWEVMKEQEIEFRKNLPVNNYEVDDFFKGVRQTEYRRGKADALKGIELAKECMNFKGIKCDNNNCLNESCPLHKRYTAGSNDFTQFKGESE